MNIGAPLFFVARDPCGPQRLCLGREAGSAEVVAV